MTTNPRQITGSYWHAPRRQKKSPILKNTQKKKKKKKNGMANRTDTAKSTWVLASKRSYNELDKLRKIPDFCKLLYVRSNNLVKTCKEAGDYSPLLCHESYNISLSSRSRFFKCLHMYLLQHYLLPSCVVFPLITAHQSITSIVHAFASTVLTCTGHGVFYLVSESWLHAANVAAVTQ